MTKFLQMWKEETEELVLAWKEGSETQAAITGFEDSTFRPHNPATREQMATLLYRYAKYKGYDLSGTASLNFADSATAPVQSWAQEAMQWAVANGLFGGYEDGSLRPQGNVTRAETATIFMRFMQKFAAK